MLSLSIHCKTFTNGRGGGCLKKQTKALDNFCNSDDIFVWLPLAEMDKKVNVSFSLTLHVGFDVVHLKIMLTNQ